MNSFEAVFAGKKGMIFVPEMKNRQFGSIEDFESWREGSDAKSLIKKYNVTVIQLQLIISETIRLKDYFVSSEVA